MSAAKPQAPARRLFITAGCLAFVAAGMILAGALSVMYALRLDDPPQIPVGQSRAAVAGTPSALPSPIASQVEVMPEPVPPEARPEELPAETLSDVNDGLAGPSSEPSPTTTPRPRPSPTPSRQSTPATSQATPETDDEQPEEQETVATSTQRRGVRGRIQSFRERRRHFPVDGIYVCLSGASGKPVQRFEIDEDTYEDLLEEQDGEFTFDLTDNTMTFTDGPLAGRYLGVSVRRGQGLKPSDRFRFSGDYGVAETNTIHLVSAGGRYTARSGLGLRCTLEE